jgi:GTPase SAR1 family protein
MKLKFVIAGPKGTGKSLIANYLSGQGEQLVSDKYDPTVGVRILQSDSKLNGISENFQIEIWDASGDHK